MDVEYYKEQVGKLISENSELKSEIKRAEKIVNSLMETIREHKCS